MVSLSVAAFLKTNFKKKKIKNFKITPFFCSAENFNIYSQGYYT